MHLFKTMDAKFLSCPIELIINNTWLESNNIKTKHAKLPTHEARVDGTHFPHRLQEQNHRMTVPEIDIEKRVTDLMFTVPF